MQYGKRVYRYIFYMLMGWQGAWSPCNVLFRAIHVQDRATVYTQISFLENYYSAFVLSTFSPPPPLPPPPFPCRRTT